MKLKEITDFLNEKIPEKLALDNDDVGFKKKYDLNQEIDYVKIYMDLYPEYDITEKSTLIITHHPPLFAPKTPTYIIHSNWDIIDGGANEALANQLKLKVIDYFDKSTKIGRICECGCNFTSLKNIISNNFKNVRAVNLPDDEKQLNKIGIISGFGLKNPKYIKLADDLNLDILISGDMTLETAVLAKNLNLTLIDLGHHESEVAGLYKLAEIINELNINCEIIDLPPIEKL